MQYLGNVLEEIFGVLFTPVSATEREREFHKIAEINSDKPTQ